MVPKGLVCTHKSCVMPDKCYILLLSCCSFLDTAMSTGYSCPFSWILLLPWPPSQLRHQSFTDCSGVPSGPKLNEPCLLRYMKDAPSLALILHLSMWIPFQCCLKPLKSYRILSKIVLFSQKPPFSPLDANMSSPGLGEKFVSQTQCYVPRIGTPLFQMISKDNYGCNSPILVLG